MDTMGKEATRACASYVRHMIIGSHAPSSYSYPRGTNRV